MADEARNWTDERLKEMERHIRRTYEQAQAEITAKWNAYMERGQARLSDLYAAYMSAPPDKKADALKKYQDAMKNYTLKNEWYREMVNDTAYRLAHTNEIAIAYINGEIPSIYAYNYNYIDPELRDIGIRWTLRDEYTVRNMMMSGDALLLPQKHLNYAKDVAWNTKQINSAVLQGIIQGESIDKIAKRITPIVGNNEKAAVRTARTMVTGAENHGRQDRYRSYQDEGVVMKKVWIATPDGRTRDWHIDIDGEEVDVDAMFVDGHGNELEYPGDPGAEPETVYNCRCTMVSHLIGIRMKDGHIERFDEEKGTSLHDRQIAEELARREDEEDGE